MEHLVFMQLLISIATIAAALLHHILIQVLG